jgi:phosphoserine phosphatase RsbU/P
MKAPSIADRLRHNILFESIDDEMFVVVQRKLRERRYSANEIIVEDASEGEELFLLVEGRVRILKTTKYGNEELLALLHPGDFFGELELVDSRPRSARVVALDDCLVYVLHKSDFDQLLHDSHPFAVRLMEVLSIRLRALNAHFVHGLELSAERSIMELKKFEQLIEATKTVNSTLDLAKLLNVILETALQVVNGDRGTVYLIDEAKQELWSKVLKGAEHIEIRLPLGKGIAGYVAATGDILNIPDAYLDPRFNPEVDKITGYQTKTILCMPMRNKDEKIIGVFQLLNKHKGTFTDEDENFIDALSVHAAIAIENARLYEQEKQKMAMDRDLVAAREVQMSLIPKQLPQVPHFEFAACTMPAHEVGGDLYDFISVDHSCCEIVIADVTGKGLPASLLATLTKGVVYAQAIQYQLPQMQLKGANRIARVNFPRKSFITMLLAVVNPEARTLTISNAGHCYPLFYRRRTKNAKILEVKGMALNFADDILCEERTIHLAPDDCVVLYSDGVTEAENSAGEFYGTERLESIVSREGYNTAQTLLQKIIDELKGFAEDVAQHDDITLVVVKATG